MMKMIMMYDIRIYEMIISRELLKNINLVIFELYETRDQIFSPVEVKPNLMEMILNT